MKKRLIKISKSKAGGTANPDSANYKISLPTKWVNEINLYEKGSILSFDGEKIIISPRLCLDEFIAKKKATSSNLLLLSYYTKDTLCTKICADYDTFEICAENYTRSITKTAFGNNNVPTWEDYENFLKERCIPEERSGLREYLETIGIDEYEPLKIIEKTEGRMAEDNQWIKIEVIK